MFQRFFDEGLAQASYLVACARTREAAVVDPRRDVDIYAAAARQHGLTIVYSIETHIHADFLSGSRELAALGARTISGPGSSLRFPAHEVRDGESLQLGDITLQLLHTPGHTPEHISMLVREPGQPGRVLTGDTLFVGAVGRPDLLGEDLTRQLAGQLYDSLFQRLLPLGDDVEVHPAHGAGSLCGAGIGSAPHSTIGQERHSNPMLRHFSKETFVTAVLADLPDTPPYFARMKQINHAGPPVLGLAAPVEAPPPIAPRAAAALVREGACLLDLRSSEAFGAGHPTRAMHLAFGPKVGYWAGWVIPPGSPIVLLTAHDEQAVETRRQLLRVGLDDVRGTIEGGFEAWREESLPVSEIEQIPAREIADRLARDRTMTVLDVRTAREWQSGHVENAIHIPVGELSGRAGDLPRDRTVVAMCEGGFRSSLATSLLERAGVRRIGNVTGGMAAYRTGAQEMTQAASVRFDSIRARLDDALRAGTVETIAQRVKDVLVEALHNQGLTLPPRFHTSLADTYARRLLHRDPDGRYTVVVMTWGPGQKTALHDHAGIWCVECVVDGQMEITQYELLSASDGAYRFREQGRVPAARGSAGCLIPPFEYHTLANVRPDGASITLHVYGGEMDHCHAFEPSRDGSYRRVTRALAYHD